MEGGGSVHVQQGIVYWVTAYGPFWECGKEKLVSLARLHFLGFFCSNDLTLAGKAGEMSLYKLDAINHIISSFIYICILFVGYLPFTPVQGRVRAKPNPSCEWGNGTAHTHIHTHGQVRLTNNRLLEVGGSKRGRADTGHERGINSLLFVLGKWVIASLVLSHKLDNVAGGAALMCFKPKAPLNLLKLMQGTNINHSALHSTIDLNDISSQGSNHICACMCA